MTFRKTFDLTLLYVEDEADTREELARFLGRRVRELLVAADGAEGLEVFGRSRPPLVVTDLRMPVLDGLSMVRAMKRLDPDVMTIVTTAHGDTSSLLEAIEIGVDRYVLKPVDTDRLLEAVDRCAQAIESRHAAVRLGQEREALIRDLEAALARVKLLRGLLPICASCKRIRDDQGYWQQIECYIRDHSEADFSHGICPECRERLYPGL